MPRLDHKTRGRTRPDRLRALDEYVLRYERPLLFGAGDPGTDALFVDLGFGEHPWTTMETSRRLREVGSPLRVVGVEREVARVQAAQTHADEWTEFRLGGFAVPLGQGERAHVIRVMNVLRGYKADVVPEIHAQLADQLVDGGLIVEGSSDTRGGVVVAHLLRKAGATFQREGLLFYTDGSRGFAPILFRDWLPRDLRRTVVAGGAMYDWIAGWTAAWQSVGRDARRDPRVAFTLSARRLEAGSAELQPDPWLAEHGYLIWNPAAGVPR